MAPRSPMIALNLWTLCWLLGVILTYLFIEGSLSAAMVFTSARTPTAHDPDACPPDSEGRWSIGIYKGRSPFELKPLEASAGSGQAMGMKQDKPWSPANPAFTCHHIMNERNRQMADSSGDSSGGGDVATPLGQKWKKSSFVADPFILPMDDRTTYYLFFETKSSPDNQGDIGAAVSRDGAQTFHYLGVVLDEPWHLSYPFVFKEGGDVYMVPEASNSGKLSLYRALDPMDPGSGGWILDHVLIDAPLIDASLVKHEGRWFLFASNRKQRSSKNCRELEVWFANGSSIHGPWSPHPLNPIRSWQQGSRPAGRPVVSNGSLFRFGQDCRLTYGHRIRAFRVTRMDPWLYEEEEVPFRVPSGGRPRIDWDSLRRHHIDLHEESPGHWIAAMDGDRVVSDYPSWDRVGRAQTLLPLSTLIFTAAMFVALNGISLPGPISLPWLASLSVGGSRINPPALANLSRSRATLTPPSKTDKRRTDKPFSPNALFWILTPAALLTTLSLLLWLVWTFGRPQLLSLVLWYVGPGWLMEAPDPLLVEGAVSKFSILVMSYEARAVTLSSFVKHYSRCPSAGEIVVVWNKGAPPLNLESSIPLRVRREAANSMNNRFRPDPDLLHRPVLMLDDDILMPCSDVERGFAAWRRHPERITGYYSRLLEGDPPTYQCIQGCERYTFQRGEYNVILAGAAFMDSGLVFPAYSGPLNKDGRDYVDEVFNCDDLLLNYLMASKLGPGVQHAQFVRPSRRFDVGKLTSKRLSAAGGNFGPVRHKCTRDFAVMFGNPLLNRTYEFDWGGRGVPFCGPSWLGCVFI